MPSQKSSGGIGWWVYFRSHQTQQTSPTGPQLDPTVAGCRLGIWIIQDILGELRNVDGGHHGEPPQKWHPGAWHVAFFEAAKSGRFEYSNIEIWAWPLNIANLWPKKFVVVLPDSSNKKPGQPMHCRAHAHVLYATSKAHINDTSLAGSAKMIIISIIIGYDVQSPLVN